MHAGHRPDGSCVFRLACSKGAGAQRPVHGWTLKPAAQGSAIPIRCPLQFQCQCQAKVLSCVPRLPLLASAGWGSDCKSVAALVAWRFRAFLSTLTFTACDVALAACVLAMLRMALVAEMSMVYFLKGGNTGVIGTTACN